MAGIFKVSREGEMQCCVVKMQANKEMSRVHLRMPVLVGKKDSKRWIDADDQEEVDPIMYASTLH